MNPVWFMGSVIISFPIKNVFSSLYFSFNYFLVCVWVRRIAVSVFERWLMHIKTIICATNQLRQSAFLSSSANVSHKFDDKCLCLASELFYRARNTKREQSSARLHVVDILHSRAIVTRSASVSQRIGFHLAFPSRLFVKIEDKNRDRFVV